MTAKRTLYFPASLRQQLLGAAEGYVVTLVAKDEQVFRDAAAHPALRSLRGVALAEKMLALFPAGDILEVVYEKNGVLEDGPAGEPAQRMFGADGARTLIRRYRGGKLNDGAQGEPAEAQQRRKGVWEISRYRDGRLHDGTKGAPAVVMEDHHYWPARIASSKKGFPYHQEGYLLVMHYQDGEQAPGPAGAPAVLVYKRGVLKEAWSVAAAKEKKVPRAEVKRLRQACPAPAAHPA